MNPSSFKIYDASAGSGKTFMLAKEYLKLLLSSTQNEPFKHILAITFTNKAVTEMKERIVGNLKAFASPEILSNPTPMFEIICDELSTRPELLKKRSKKMLENIVHNYAAFDVSTIDKFTHKLIRTFALDLRLSMNFDVELDTDEVLSQAIDNLIAKAGSDKQLTKLLVDFAIEKADDDKSYNIEVDFMPIAKLITNESNAKYIEALSDKTFKDFNALKSQLNDHTNSIELKIKNESRTALTLIDECGLEHTDFMRSTLPNHFIKASLLKFYGLYNNKLEGNLSEKQGLYKTTTDTAIAETIDKIVPNLEMHYLSVKQLVSQYKFFQAIYKNLTPLSVLAAINNEVETIKTEENIVLISEFNPIVSHHIKTQPIPFIYERIGEKYKHYFIDEFQDTSVMQWENLVPLIENALSGEKATAFIVGDAKQAIYRWRGGKAEQFIELGKTSNLLPIHGQRLSLDKNYRSDKNIVEFNNAIFKHISDIVFTNPLYKKLYESSTQNIVNTSGGYVNMTFLSLDKEDDKNENYPAEVLATINKCLDNGCSPKDITVLVRKNKQGVAIAEYITENSDVQITSSESLLLINSPEVNFIINLLKLSLDKHNKQLKVNVLSYLADHKLDIKDNHDFFYTFVHLETEAMFSALQSYGIHFNLFETIQRPLYEAVETIIHYFKLVKASDAYLQFLLDFVHDFVNTSGRDLSEFISHFEHKKDKLSIVASENTNAINIMTIHKAKGLEFSVVIFPYANIDIYDKRNHKVWYTLNPEQFNGFKYALINYNKDLEDFGDQGIALYSENRSEMELDNINVLYVALTRAKDQLYIITEKPKSSSNQELKTYSDFFKSYLQQKGLWDTDQLIYEFGDFSVCKANNEIQKTSISQKQFISTPLPKLNISIASNAQYLWNPGLKEAIEKGNLLHLIMSQIMASEDIDNVFGKLISTGIVDYKQHKNLKSIVSRIVSHPDLKPYFNFTGTIYTEKEILTAEGNTLIPDRIMINNNKDAVIIDYKTGKESTYHEIQLKVYQDVLQEMGYSVIKKLLVYINEPINVKEV